MRAVGMSDAAALERAAELGRRHRMHYEVEPEVHFGRDGAKRRVGIRIRISGAHPRGSAPQPGCTLCRSIHTALHEVAEAVLPTESAAIRWEFLPFSPSLYWAPADDADEVSLFVLGMADDYARGVGPAEDAEVRALRRRLEALGVCEGRWRASPTRDQDDEAPGTTG